MSAQEIISALQKVDKVKIFEAILRHVDVDTMIAKVIEKAEAEGKLEPWMSKAAQFLNFTGEEGVNFVIEMALSIYKPQELFDKWLNAESPDVIPTPILPPPPIAEVKKITNFQVIGEPAKLLFGHDNGITCVGGNALWMFTGDGPTSGIKHETSLFKLSNGNPMESHNWKAVKHTNGKTYGNIWYNGHLLSCQSDKGSGYEGASNCRIWDVQSGRRSTKTLQSLYGFGMNWFFVHGVPFERKVVVGCVEFAHPGYAAHNKNFKTPVRLWQGDPYNINSFKSLGPVQGLVGKRTGHWSTTCSITYLPQYKKFLGVLGDWTVSENQYFLSDHMRGPYQHFKTDRFSPPMKRKSTDDGHQWSGVFTSNVIFWRGEWYEILSGHRADLAASDDSVWIRIIRWIR